MIRQSLSLTEDQNRRIEEESRRTGLPKTEVARRIIESGIKTRVRRPSQKNTNLGLSEREIKRYNFGNVLKYEAARAGVISDFSIQDKMRFEMECSKAVQQKSGIRAQGTMVPMEIFNRTLTAGTATDGAELVTTDLKAQSFIDVLRNESVVLNMGATTLTDLSGDVAIPRKTSGSSASWIATEDGDAANSEPQFDQVSMTPHTLGCYTDVSRQLLLQSSLDMFDMIFTDLARGIGTEIDRAALYGTGSSGEPTGISQTTGINAPTNFAAATPTFTEVVAMETAVAVDNALLGNKGYIIEPTMRGNLRVAEKASNTGVFVMEEKSLLNGYKTGVTGNVTSGDVFFGNWADLIIGMWGGLDILVDRYTFSLSGKVRLVAHQTVDFCVRHPESFAFNNDGA